MHNAQLRLRKFLAQFLDQSQRRIVSLAHAEQHFVFWVFEPAMAAKSAVHVGIEPLQRPQDTDWRSETRLAITKTGALALKAAARGNAHREISRASQGQQRAKHSNSGERRMH